MAGNKAVAYMGPGKVEIRTIDYPTFELSDGPGVNPANVGRKTPHGVILKNVATNICGSDQHMVRGRTTAPEGLVLGHEITGEVVEVGPGVEFIKVGDLCSVPFNISCGRCRNCKEGKTGICENVNPDRPGSAYGYVDMGGWVGGQAQYVLVPYADWNLLKFPDKDQAMAKILDLAMLSDIFPTGYHGCVSAGVTTGSTVYIAGADLFFAHVGHSRAFLFRNGVLIQLTLEHTLERLISASAALRRMRAWNPRHRSNRPSTTGGRTTTTCSSMRSAISAPTSSACGLPLGSGPSGSWPATWPRPGPIGSTTSWARGTPRSATCSASRARPSPAWRSRTPHGRTTRTTHAGPPRSSRVSSGRGR